MLVYERMTHHPITVHHAGGLLAWAPFLGDDRFDLTSFQTQKATQNSKVIDWREDSAASGRPLAISFDETGKISSAERDLGRHILWSVYMGGGMFEMHTWPIDTFQQFEGHWNDMFTARAYWRSNSKLTPSSHQSDGLQSRYR